jgi:hypothetical protein
VTAALISGGSMAAVGIVRVAEHVASAIPAWLGAGAGDVSGPGRTLPGDAEGEESVAGSESPVPGSGPATARDDHDADVLPRAAIDDHPASDAGTDADAGTTDRPGDADDDDTAVDGDADRPDHDDDAPRPGRSPGVEPPEDDVRDGRDDDEERDGGGDEDSDDDDEADTSEPIEAGEPDAGDDGMSGVSDSPDDSAGPEADAAG